MWFTSKAKVDSNDKVDLRISFSGEPRKDSNFEISLLFSLSLASPALAARTEESYDELATADAAITFLILSRISYVLEVLKLNPKSAYFVF